MLLLWFRQLPWCGDRTPAVVPLPTEGRSSPSNTPVSPPSSFILPSFVWFYIFFSMSGTPLHSQMVFCRNVCVWRCTSDLSVERDVLHVHLLLSLLILSHVFFNHINSLLPFLWLYLLWNHALQSFYPVITYCIAIVSFSDRRKKKHGTEMRQYLK